MEYIRSWLKSIIFVNVILLLCDQFFQKTTYEKYVRFFTGFLMILCLLQPILDLSGNMDRLRPAFLKSTFSKEWKLILKDEEEDRRQMKKEYEKAYQTQMAQILEKNGDHIISVDCDCEDETGSIRTINIKVKKRKDQSESNQKKDISDRLMQFYLIESSNINIEIQE